MHPTAHMQVKAHARKRNYSLLYLGKTFQVNINLIINLNQYLFHSNQSRLNDAIFSNQIQFNILKLIQNDWAPQFTLFQICSLKNFKNFFFLKNFKYLVMYI